ncbi:TRAP transporter small permease subunit, partial [Chloroflexota bacterium]
NEGAVRIVSFFILAAVMVTVYGVVRRYVFNAPTVIELELTTFLCAVTYLLAGGYAQSRDAHVRVDVLYLRWSPRGRAILRLVTIPIFFGGLCALLWGSADWTIKAMISGEHTGSYWEPPVWPVRLLIPLGALLLILQGIVSVVRDFRIARGKEPS